MSTESSEVSEARGSIEARVERSAKQIGWLEGIVGALVTVFVAGAIAMAYVQKFATKDEVAKAIAEHAVSNDGHSTMAKDVADLKLQMVEQRNDTQWIRESIRRMLNASQLSAPEEPHRRHGNEE